MHIHPSSPNSDSAANSLQSEESAAIKIQAGFRGYRVRKQLHHHQQRSATNGYHHHQQHRHHHHHHTHRRQARRSAGMTTPSETATGASINGGASATAQLREARVSYGVGDASNSIEDRCATKIQAGVRGFLVRKKQKIATDAATKIQAGFRGFKARKEAQKLKQK